MRTSLLCILVLGLGHAGTALAVEVSTVQVTQTEAPTMGATPEATMGATSEATMGATPEATPVATSDVAADPTLVPTEPVAVQTAEAPTVEPSATPEAAATEEISPTVTETPVEDLKVMEFGSQGTPTVSSDVPAGSELSVTATASAEPTVEPAEMEEESMGSMEEEDGFGEEEAEEEEAGASMLSGYDGVERLGAALTAGEWRVDGRIASIRDGEILGKRIRQVVIIFEEGKKARKGDRFVVFRPAKFGVKAQGGLRAAEAVGVLKVVGAFGDGMLASVERQFSAVRMGDLVRSRQVDKKAYQLALSKATKKSVKGLAGRVLSSVDGRIMATRHGGVFIDLGMADGAAIGMRFDIVRKVEHGGPGGSQSVKPVGQFGQLEIVNVFERGAVAVIVRSKGYVKAGDLIQSR